MTKRPVKYVWEGVIDPAMGRNIGWRDMMKNDLDDATRFAAEWERLWGQYTPPELSVFGQYFPKWRDEKMEEQEKQKQEETDRYFAWLGAKHAMRAVEAELSAADARLAAARLRLEEAKQETRMADDLCAKAVRAAEAVRSVVALLEPKTETK